MNIYAALLCVSITTQFILGMDPQGASERQNRFRKETLYKHALSNSVLRSKIPHAITEYQSALSFMDPEHNCPYSQALDREADSYVAMAEFMEQCSGWEGEEEILKNISSETLEKALTIIKAKAAHNPEVKKRTELRKTIFSIVAIERELSNLIKQAPLLIQHDSLKHLHLITLMESFKNKPEEMEELKRLRKMEVLNLQYSSDLLSSLLTNQPLQERYENTVSAQLISTMALILPQQPLVPMPLSQQLIPSSYMPGDNEVPVNNNTVDQPPLAPLQKTNSKEVEPDPFSFLEEGYQ